MAKTRKPKFRVGQVVKIRSSSRRFERFAKILSVRRVSGRLFYGIEGWIYAMFPERELRQLTKRERWVSRG